MTNKTSRRFFKVRDKVTNLVRHQRKVSESTSSAIEVHVHKSEIGNENASQSLKQQQLAPADAKRAPLQSLSNTTPRQTAGKNGGNVSVTETSLDFVDMSFGGRDMLETLRLSEKWLETQTPPPPPLKPAVVSAVKAATGVASLWTGSDFGNGPGGELGHPAQSTVSLVCPAWRSSAPMASEMKTNSGLPIAQAFLRKETPTTTPTTIKTQTPPPPPMPARQVIQPTEKDFSSKHVTVSTYKASSGYLTPVVVDSLSSPLSSASSQLQKRTSSVAAGRRITLHSGQPPSTHQTQSPRPSVNRMSWEESCSTAFERQLAYHPPPQPQSQQQKLPIRRGAAAPSSLRVELVPRSPSPVKMVASTTASASLSQTLRFTPEACLLKPVGASSSSSGSPPGFPSSCRHVVREVGLLKPVGEASPSAPASPTKTQRHSMPPLTHQHASVASVIAPSATATERPNRWSSWRADTTSAPRSTPSQPSPQIRRASSRLATDRLAWIKTLEEGKAGSSSSDHRVLRTLSGGVADKLAKFEQAQNSNLQSPPTAVPSLTRTNSTASRRSNRTSLSQETAATSVMVRRASSVLGNYDDGFREKMEALIGQSMREEERTGEMVKMGRRVTAVVVPVVGVRIGELAKGEGLADKKEAIAEVKEQAAVEQVEAVEQNVDMTDEVKNEMTTDVQVKEEVVVAVKEGLAAVVIQEAVNEAQVSKPVTVNDEPVEEFSSGAKSAPVQSEKPVTHWTLEAVTALVEERTKATEAAVIAEPKEQKDEPVFNYAEAENREMVTESVLVATPEAQQQPEEPSPGAETADAKTEEGSVVPKAFHEMTHSPVPEGEAAIVLVEDATSEIEAAPMAAASVEQNQTTVEIASESISRVDKRTPANAVTL